MDFDAYGLKTPAFSDKKSDCSQMESEYALSKVMNDELVIAFNNKSFTKGIPVIRIKKVSIQKI